MSSPNRPSSVSFIAYSSQLAGLYFLFFGLIVFDHLASEWLVINLAVTLGLVIGGFAAVSGKAWAQSVLHVSLTVALLLSLRFVVLSWIFATVMSEKDPGSPLLAWVVFGVGVVVMALLGINLAMTFTSKRFRAYFERLRER